MMTSQTIPSRNPSAAAGMGGKVSVGKGSKAPHTASSVHSGTGPSGGKSIKGFGGGSTPSNVLSGGAGKNGHSPGKSVKGFSGNGVIGGKV